MARSLSMSRIRTPGWAIPAESAREVGSAIAIAGKGSARGSGSGITGIGSSTEIAAPRIGRGTSSGSGRGLASGRESGNEIGIESSIGTKVNFVYTVSFRFVSFLPIIYT